MKNFALIGAAGYIAPRHFKAIKETANNLLCVLDPNDSVGIMDAYFPEAAFFTEFERFDRHVERLNRSAIERSKGLKVEKSKAHLDYVSVCSPNYLHDAHIRWALRSGANVICEKPLGLNPRNIDALEELSLQSGLSVNTILQLRLHPEVLKIRESGLRDSGLGTRDSKRKVRLTYITPRGVWYKYSWKGDVTKSGGIATNIGIHLFDLLIWLFGKVENSYLHLKKDDKMAGFLELENAEVSWYLSTDKKDLSKVMSSSTPMPLTSYRALDIEGASFDFTSGFTNLHTTSYEKIIGGHGFSIADARPAIKLVHEIRHARVAKGKGEVHSLVGG